MPAPPANEWSVQVLNADGSVAGSAGTLASLGIEDFSVDENNLAADVGAFTVGGRDIDAATLWPYGTLLAVLRPDGTRAFVGRVEPWTRDGRPDAQNHLGRLVNPWWYLEHKIYEQTYTLTKFVDLPVVGGPNPTTTVTYTTPRVVLNVLYDPVSGFYAATNGQQIADAVNWAIGLGAPITLGTVDPATKPFSEMQKGIRCSDVLVNCFRKEPDFVIDWDYTTLPFPTVHFRKTPSLIPLTIDLTVPGVHERISLKERPDWQRSYVKINYDQQNTSAGATYLAIYADWYSALGQGNDNNGDISGAALPTDTESRFRGVDLFCDLSGNATSSTSQTVSFASLPFDITSLTTWAQWKPALAAANVRQVVILSASTVPAADANRPLPAIATVNELDDAGAPINYNADCAYEVVDGQWAAWIPGVAGQRVRATAWAMIVQKNGTVKYEQLTKEMTVVSYNTAGVSKEFTSNQTSVTQYAEPLPVGLARAMWTSWQNLAIEGSFNQVEAVVGTAQPVTRSNCLNFLTTAPGANGRPDWRAVNAMVQRRTWTIQNGVTSIQFGAPLRITGHDLIDAVRATRYRTQTIDLAYLFGGASASGTAKVQFGRKTHAHHTQHGATHKEVDVVSQSVTPQAGVDPVVVTNGVTGVSTWVPPNGPTVNTTGTPQSSPVATIDPAKCKGSDGNWHSVTFQEQKVCVKINGLLKQRTLIAWTSEIYQAPDDPA